MLADLVAQMTDMDLDDIAFLVGIVGVDVLAEFGLGKHLARVQHHVAQQAEFDAAERARDAIADCRLAVLVEAQRNTGNAAIRRSISAIIFLYSAPPMPP